MAISKPYKYTDGEKHNQFSISQYSTLLAANVEQTLTVPFLSSSQSPGVNTYIPSTPGGAPIVANPGIVAVIKIGSSSSVMVNNNATAAYPTSTFSLGGGEMVNAQEMMIKQVQANDVLHFITNASNVPVNVVFYISN